MTVEGAVALLDAMPVGVVSLGPRWEVLSWNRAAAGLVGVPVEEALGAPFFELVLDRVGREGAIARLRDAPADVPVTVSCRSRAGAAVAIEVTAAPVGSGRAQRVLLLTPSRAAPVEAAPSGILTPDGASRLLHDVANPLNALLGFAYLLRNGDAGALPPVALEMVDDIVAAGRELQDLLEVALSPATRARA